MAPWTMPPSTLLLAGGRPAAIAPSATPLQWTTAFSAGAADVDDLPAGPMARATTSDERRCEAEFGLSVLFLRSLDCAPLVLWM